MVGEITWIDFLIADFIQALGLMNSEYFEKYPKLKEYQKRVWELPELKDYFSS